MKNELCPESEIKRQDLASYRTSKVCTFLKVCHNHFYTIKQYCFGSCLGIYAISYHLRKLGFELLDKTVNDENPI